MAHLYFTVGIPGSGKSTWIKNHFNEDNIVSRDDIRFSLLKDGEDYFAHEKEVFNIYIDKLKEGLKTKDYMVADATHLTPASRLKLINALTRNGDFPFGLKITPIVFDIPLDVALNHNELRKDTDRYVTRGVIRRMFFQMTAIEDCEGFDSWIIVNQENKLRSIEKV